MPPKSNFLREYFVYGPQIMSNGYGFFEEQASYISIDSDPFSDGTDGITLQIYLCLKNRNIVIEP
jgi:hypothetical protein